MAGESYNFDPELALRSRFIDQKEKKEKDFTKYKTYVGYEGEDPNCKIVEGFFSFILDSLENMTFQHKNMSEKFEKSDLERLELYKTIFATKEENSSLEARVVKLEIENQAIKVDSQAIKDDNQAIKAENQAIKDDNQAIKDDNQAFKDDCEKKMTELKKSHDSAISALRQEFIDLLSRSTSNSN